MVKSKLQLVLVWVMVLLIVFGAFSSLNGALADTPASLDVDVSVIGIEEDGIIDGSSAIGITAYFPVPVKGDGVDDYFMHNDEVTFLRAIRLSLILIHSVPLI